MSNSEEFSSSEIANFMRKMMHQSRRYKKKGVKKIFSDNKKRGKSSTKSKLKSYVVCFKCNRRDTINCPKLKKAKGQDEKKEGIESYLE